MVKSDKFWDKAAERYAKSAISDEATYQRKLIETQSLFAPEMRVLEFGCGTGTTAVHHAAYVKHIDAIDISENMLEIGRGKARDAGIDNVKFTRGTLTDFNAGTASYDVVLGLNVIHLLPDRQTVIAEVARILKPGGIFVSSTGCLGNSFLRFIKLIVPLGKLLRLMPDVFVLTEAELASEIANAGFAIENQWHHGMNNIDVFMIARRTPDIKDSFLAYVDAFEITYKDNDWPRLEQFFTEGATYDSGLGDAAVGRAAVMSKLENAVDEFDRLMDTRVLDFTPPVVEGDTVSIHWTAYYSKAGVPNLQFGGTEYAQFDGGRISHLRDELDAGTEETLNNWLGKHGESLSV